MNLVENSVWNFDINGKPALNALGELEAKLAEVKKAQGDLTRGTKEWTENKAEIKELEAEIKKVREEMGTSGMTVKQLENYYRQLNKELKDLTPGTEEYIKKTEDLRDVNTRLAAVRKDVRAVADEADDTKGVWGRMKEWIMGAFVVTAVLEAGQMIKQFFGDAIENFKKFESASKEMSANTKIVGDELKYLEDQAKSLGPEMGKTGDEMLAAYQAMGSAKSDLTDNAAALASVTKEAIILSQAGKIDLAPATELMAGALNQFNAPAEDAGRFINAIAAGAQVGSAEIADMTGALKASGTVANAANVSFEETNGALQSLSTINIKGEQAGTMFRNVLIKLMSSTEDLNPQVVGLDKALENLGNRNMSTAELAKMFGTENVVAAQHLVTHRDQVEEFTQALTGTDEAYKMAAVNNDTLEFKQKQSEAATANLGVALGEKLHPFIIRAYDGFGSFLGIIGDVIEGSTPLFNAFMMLWDVLGNLFGSVGKMVGAFFGLDEKTNGTKAVMQTLGVVFGSVTALAASLVAVIQLVIDGLLFLDGKITFDQLKNNAANNFNSIKAGLKSTFVDSFKEVEGASVQAAANLTQKQGAAQKSESKKTSDEIASNEIATHSKTLSTKSAESKKHLDEVAAKAKVAADKEAADKLAANSAATKAIEKLNIDAITNELARKKAQLAFELSEKLANNSKSKADDLVKVNYEIALRGQYKTAVEKLEADYRAKHIADEAKRIAEINKLEEAQRNERQAKEFNTTKTILETKLSNERLNIGQRQALKLQLIDLERQQELARIEQVAAAERAKAIETSNQLMKLAGDDAAKKKQIETETAAALRSIDSNRIAQTDSANAAHQAALKANEAATLAERKTNQQGFFDAVKALMSGDYAGFMDILNKKLANEKAMNNARLQNWTSKGQEIVGIVQQGMALIQKIGEAKTAKELANITKEKNAQLKSWEDKYKKGLIDKNTYENGIDKINKDALQKEHDAKVKAWKREQKMQIGMALINAAMAALKSLAMMGFPLGLIGVVASAALAAVQIGIIKSQSPPSMAKGGFIRNAGVPQGPRHGQKYGDSGISLIRRDTNEEVGEMEGDEPIMILSRNTYKNNRHMIDALLDSSLHRNGAPIHAAKGTVFGSDGGDYRELLEPLQFGQSYLFGSKKRKAAKAAAAAQEQADKDAAAMQAELDAEVAKTQSEMGDTGGYDADMNPYGDVEGGDADGTTAATSAEIGRSQKMMDTIGKNTGETVMALMDIKDSIDGLHGKLSEIKDAANNAANGSWAAANASNRAADVMAMAGRNNL